MSADSLSVWVIRLLAITTIWTTAHTAQAHVTLNAPNGGETLAAGDDVTISWVIAIPHITENWDLYYSVTGRNGPWQIVAEDLPLGDPAINSVHTHVWTVPDISSTQVRLRVVQDNLEEDYEDISDASLTIQGTADAIVVDDPADTTTGASMCGATGMASFLLMVLGLTSMGRSTRFNTYRRRGRYAAVPGT